MESIGWVRAILRLCLVAQCPLVTLRSSPSPHPEPFWTPIRFAHCEERGPPTTRSGASDRTAADPLSWSDPTTPPCASPPIAGVFPIGDAPDAISLGSRPPPLRRNHFQGSPPPRMGGCSEGPIPVLSTLDPNVTMNAVQDSGIWTSGYSNETNETCKGNITMGDTSPVWQIASTASQNKIYFLSQK